MVFNNNPEDVKKAQAQKGKGKGSAPALENTNNERAPFYNLLGTVKFVEPKEDKKGGLILTAYTGDKENNTRKYVKIWVPEKHVGFITPEDDGEPATVELKFKELEQ